MKLIIFDCDGTLVDSQHMIVAAMAHAYAAHALPLPARERLLSIVGLSLPQAFEALAGGDSLFPVASMVESYKAAFHALRKSEQLPEPLFPGALETVRQLAACDDVALGIATGKSRRGVDAVLGRHDLAQCFVTIKTADDAPSKPHPGMVLAAMEEAGVAANDTVVVGDTVFDIGMARAAGVRGIGVSWGYQTRDELAAAGAHAVIDEFAALVPMLERVWRA